MDAEAITLARHYGASEDKLCESLNVTHLQLRQFTLANNIKLDYDILSDNLLAEIVLNRNWAHEKLASRYHVPLLIIKQILVGTYIGPREQPDIDILELQHLANQGYHFNEMAFKLHTTIYYIKKALKDHNLITTRQKITAQQYDEIVHSLHLKTKDLAKKYNLSPSMISHIRRETENKVERKALVRADPELVVKLVNAGFTQVSIAKQLNIAQGTVSRLYKENKNVI
jgi:transcriptional regulator with XRE-family HTH domain